MKTNILPHKSQTLSDLYINTYKTTDDTEMEFRFYRQRLNYSYSPEDILRPFRLL